VVVARRAFVLTVLAAGLVLLLWGVSSRESHARAAVRVAPPPDPPLLRHTTRRIVRPLNVYAADGAHMLSPVARRARPLVYVPNSESDTVDVIDQRTFKTVEHLRVGALPQHVVPAYNLRTLYVTNDAGNSLTPINPTTGRRGRGIPVTDP
jgi:YVTN family beta-propeller protein